MSLKLLINENEIRESLKKIIRSNPDTADNISNDIGVSVNTLKKFLMNGSLDFKRLCKIEDWIKKKECKDVQ